MAKNVAELVNATSSDDFLGEFVSPYYMDPSLRHTCNLLPSRDSNPGPVFPIPRFKTEDFVILELSDHAENMGFTTIKPIMRAVCSHIYRVAQKAVHFSAHHIFGTVQDKMKQISPICVVPGVSGNQD